MKRKKSKLLLIIIILLLVITGCKNKTNNDGKLFKDEFEKYNDTYIALNIDEDNPFVIKTQEEIIKSIDSEKAFVVFYANPKDNNSRQMVDSIIKEAKNLSLKTVYYVQMDGESNYQINDKKIEKYPSLVAVIKKDMYSLINNKEEISTVIEPVVKELSSCDIDVGC